jgi:transposase-like protein
MSTNNKKGAGKGKRYTDAEKKEIIAYVEKVNAEKGRGGQSAAAKKFGISQLTISSWLKAGISGGRAAASTSAAPAKGGAAARGGISSKLSTLLALGNEIEKAERELTKMKAKFNSVKASL